MFENLDNPFKREGLKTNSEIINWWDKGRAFLNWFLVIYALLYTLIMWFVFNDFWYAPLLLEFAFIIILINIFYSIGGPFELLAIKYFNCKWNFDILAPIVKKVVLIISIAFVVLLSLFLIWDA